MCMKHLEKFMQNVPCGTIPCLGPKFYKPPPTPFVCIGGEGTSNCNPSTSCQGWGIPPFNV